MSCPFRTYVIIVLRSFLFFAFLGKIEERVPVAFSTISILLDRLPSKVKESSLFFYLTEIRWGRRDEVKRKNTENDPREKNQRSEKTHKTTHPITDIN